MSTFDFESSSRKTTYDPSPRRCARRHSRMYSSEAQAGMVLRTSSLRLRRLEGQPRCSGGRALPGKQFYHDTISMPPRALHWANLFRPLRGNIFLGFPGRCSGPTVSRATPWGDKHGPGRMNNALWKKQTPPGFEPGGRLSLRSAEEL